MTFSSASSPSPADSARKPQLLTSCSRPTRADVIVLDDQHPFGNGVWGDGGLAEQCHFYIVSAPG